MIVHQTAADDASTAPAHGRPGSRWRVVSVAARLSALASLLLACAPAAPAAPTSAPATQAAVAKPTTAPTVAAPAAPTTAPAAQPTAAAKPAAAAQPTAAPAAAARVEPKGSIVVALNEEPPMLAYHDATASFSYPVMRNVTEALLNRDPVTNELVPELATKWEQTNPTTWRFTLRQGVKFHDGTPWNAEAAADNINEMFKKENNYRVRTYLGPDVEAKPVSEYVVDVITAAPDPILPTRLYFAPFHSPTARKANPDDVPIKPIGTGPYKFVEWIKGQHIKLTANPDWWGNTAADAGGAVTIKDVTFVPRTAREVRAAMVQSGETDLARWISQEECKVSPQCKGAPTVETIFIRLDTMNPTLADRRVREAIALAVDKDAIANRILGGGDLAAMLIRPTVLGYNPALKPYPYDLARAKALIAEAKAAGVPVDAPLTLLARRGAYFRIEEALEAVGDMLKQAGLTNVTLQVMEVSKHTEIYNAPKPIDPARGIIALHSHGNELLDFGQTVRFYYTCDGRQSTYCNPAVDEMQNRAQSLGGTEREKAYQEIAKLMYDEVVTVPIMHPSFYFGMSKRLEWTPRPDGFTLLKEMKLKE
jgi:peptide/nickel transport system substrate-binding protein